MSKKGGYVIVDLKGQTITAGTPFTLDGVTARLDRAKSKACLLSGFAIGGEEKRDVFIDLQPTEDGYIAFFGQYTITIEDDEITVTNGGVLLNDIVDSQGNKRFVEGEGTVSPIDGVTITYNKWSLSGTHLMFVLSGTAVDTSVITGNLVSFTLPAYITDKINPVGSNLVDYKVVRAFNEDLTSYQDIVTNLNKTGNILNIRTNSITMNADRKFRFQFDLLIDTDVAE